MSETSIAKGGGGGEGGMREGDVRERRMNMKSLDK